MIGPYDEEHAEHHGRTETVSTWDAFKDGPDWKTGLFQMPPLLSW